MARNEVLPNDPSVDFGKDQALHFYCMARSLGFPSNRSIGDLAEGAIRQAMREYDRPDVDILTAKASLIHAIISPDFPRGFNYVVKE